MDLIQFFLYYFWHGPKNQTKKKENILRKPIKYIRDKQVKSNKQHPHAAISHIVMSTSY
jgi:hypothetical protein